MSALVGDLRGETDALEALLIALGEPQWGSARPAEGWSIKDQVSHLAYFDEMTTLSAADPDAFRAAATAELDDIDGFTSRIASEHHDRSGADLLRWWRSARTRMVDVMGALDPSVRVPWCGLGMSA